MQGIALSSKRDNLVPALFKSLRPKQWVKNGFVLFPLIFWFERGLTWPVNDDIVGKLLVLVELFVSFCLAASAGYQVNDIFDVEKDRLHPTKCRRPLAAGLISQGQAAALAVALATISIVLARHVGWVELGLVALYTFLTNSYNVKGKEVKYLDVVLVGVLYGIRVAAGFSASKILPDGWGLWIVLAALLATYVELGKRHAEFRNVGSEAKTRSVLAQYNERAFNTLYLGLTGLIVMTYIPASVQIGGVFTLSIVLVVYGLWSFRRTIEQLTEDLHPMDVFFHSTPLLITVVAFLALLGLTVATQ